MRANVEMMDSGYARADVNMALPGQRGLLFSDGTVRWCKFCWKREGST